MEPLSNLKVKEDHVSKYQESSERVSILDEVESNLSTGDTDRHASRLI